LTPNSFKIDKSVLTSSCFASKACVHN